MAYIKNRHRLEAMPIFFNIVTYGLVSNECEALESGDLQILKR